VPIILQAATYILAPLSDLFRQLFFIPRENPALPVISVIRVMLSGYSGYGVLHHAIYSIFNYLFNLSKNTLNSELFGLTTPYTAHGNWGVTHSTKYVTYTKGVTYSQMGVLFVECSVFPCQHRPC
jgi:hypothetical protein